MGQCQQVHSEYQDSASDIGYNLQASKHITQNAIVSGFKRHAIIAVSGMGRKNVFAVLSVNPLHWRAPTVIM